MKVCESQLNVVEDDASPYLWHKQLVHMSEKGLQLLAKQSLIPMVKGNQTPMTIVYLESITEFHSRRIPIKIGEIGINVF